MYRLHPKMKKILTERFLVDISYKYCTCHSLIMDLIWLVLILMHIFLFGNMKHVNLIHLNDSIEYLTTKKHFNPFAKYRVDLKYKKF